MISGSELGRIAAVCHNHAGANLRAVCEMLATLSRSNADAFVAEYSGRYGSPEPYTAESILAEAATAPTKTHDAYVHAANALTSLHYHTAVELGGPVLGGRGARSAMHKLNRMMRRAFVRDDALKEA